MRILIAVIAGILTTPATASLPVEHDWWLVSTSGSGASQNRFYADRNRASSMLPQSKAWFDLYRYDAKAGLKHSKFLVVANCNENSPRVQFRSRVEFDQSGRGGTPSAPGNWMDVVPDTAQETLWRFTCHATPENAIVFVPDTPDRDANRFFQKR